MTSTQYTLARLRGWFVLKVRSALPLKSVTYILNEWPVDLSEKIKFHTHINVSYNYTDFSHEIISNHITSKVLPLHRITNHCFGLPI